MNTGLVVLIGLGVVFFGLICLVGICKLLGMVVQAIEAKLPALAKETPSVKSASPDPGPRGEIIAAVAAAIAEELGEDVSGIRILSLRKL